MGRDKKRAGTDRQSSGAPLSNQQRVKMITWTAASRAAFTTLKELVNEFPKLYFIKKE
jgi:hypothetical protein